MDGTDMDETRKLLHVASRMMQMIMYRVLLWTVCHIRSNRYLAFLVVLDTNTSVSKYRCQILFEFYASIVCALG